MRKSLCSLIILVSLYSFVTAECATNERILGAGSTLVASLQKQLSFAFEQGPHKVSYSAVGSGAGKSVLIQEQVQFAATESALSASELSQATDLQMLPTFASAVSIVYNLPGDSRALPLNLTKSVLAGIFSGSVQRWADPRILATNPALADVLAAAPRITRVVRQGSSGTTDVFTSALSTFNSTAFPSSFSTDQFWKTTTDSQAPLVTAVENSGVALSVVWTPGAIGYIGHATAVLYQLPYAAIINEEGTPVLPSASSLEAATKLLVRNFTAAFVGSLINAGGGNAYPIAGWTYYLIRMRSAPCCSKAYWLRKFLLWCATDPVVRAAALDESFVPVPLALQPRYYAVLDEVMCVEDGKLHTVVSLKERYEPSPTVRSAIPLVVGVSSGCGMVVIILLFVTLRVWREHRRRAEQRLMEANAAPRGTVCIIFTDIQGSTALWGSHHAEMKEALAQHNVLLRRLIKLENGYEVKSEGDSIFASFHGTFNGIRFAFRAQEALSTHPWDEKLLGQPDTLDVIDANGMVLMRGLRVRMGIGWGPVDDVMDTTTLRVDYFGPTVNLTARVAALGHGGQILLTNSAYTALLSDEAALGGLGNPTVRSVGEHRLKGIDQPEPVYEIASPLLTARIASFPPLRTDNQPRGGPKQKQPRMHSLMPAPLLAESSVTISVIPPAPRSHRSSNASGSSVSGVSGRASVALDQPSSSL
eukprot:TRINITY_DN10357_c0_g1_i1.p1 TRINITY_DN10357_c0_g1~~TRINITY_DN10357_c0_g1_i1.p1  ORF type:complete len:703 (+),score=97.46 TRINITY_DN10357_c0_g1_i1:744-2852(+)